ncbi:MAG: tRNA uridine-5-carboxymethylaminomethyl(34) synthesis GTPase MnmE, partial [Moorea sp. SIO3I6]|nr:tRNA uridine-5-carboxymethylaminomethyl(34) synthesis GTPase MnmE [Moorena sp. SIO3I6]
ADLVLLVIEATTGWSAGDQEIYQQVQERPVILVINKTDLASDKSESTVCYPNTIEQVVKTAAAYNQGIDALEKAILDAVNRGNLQAADLDLAINQRQAAALTRAKMSLEQVQETIAQELPLDFWTIDLRGAIQALGEITGEEVTESVLDRIFSRFCIGK